MRRRILALFLTCFLLPVAFSSCGEDAEVGEPSGGDGDITGRILYSSHRTDFQNTVLPEYVADFNKRYPHVEVIIETITDYRELMKIKMSSDDLPDVWSVHPTTFSREQLQHYNLPLDDLDFTSDFLTLDQFTGNDGHVYALPTGLVAVGVVYNKQIFAELGLRVPTTLTEFISAGQTIAGSGRVGLATASRAKWPLQYYWQDICKMISGDPNVRNNMVFSDDPFSPDSAVYKSYALLKKFVDAGILEPDPLSADWEPMKEEFRRGNVGMFLLGNWFIPQVVSDTLTVDDIGFFPLPYNDSEGAKNVTAGPDVALAIAQKTKSPEAAMAFLTFLMTDKYSDFAQRCGLLSARKSISVDLPFVNEYNSFLPSYLDEVGDSKELQDILTKMEFDFQATAQEVVGGKALDEIFSALNAKWKAAR